MSNITLPNNAGRVDTFTRQEGADTVHMQAIVPVSPATGDPIPLATETTLAALSAAIETLNSAAAAIKAAVESLNTKTTAVNTGAITGTVALDAPTLAALENINAATGLSQPLTNTELRAAAVPVSGQFYPATQPVSAAALPLPAGAAAESTLAALKSSIDALNAKITVANTGAIAGTVALDAPTLAALENVTADTGLEQPLTDAQLRMSPLSVIDSVAATESTQQEMLGGAVYLLCAILEKMPRVNGNDQCAVSVEAGSVGLAANTDMRNITGYVNDQRLAGGSYISGANMMLAGAGHLYNNIVVS